MSERIPQVSVIMPAYNAEKHIEEAIRSVIDQTMTDWELIVIDDGSTDGTTEIIETFLAVESRIRFYKNKNNRGVSYSRNLAISLAQGKWVAFLDSDDFWRQDKLEKQIQLAEKNPDMVICFTASAFINAEGREYRYVLEAPDQVTYGDLLRKNLLSCSSVMVSASVIKEIEMPNDHMHEDYYAWLTILRKYRFAYGINEPLLIYRLGFNTKSSNRLKSAKMQFNTYRSLGYSKGKACYFVCRYLPYSIKKRVSIRKSME